VVAQRRGLCARHILQPAEIGSYYLPEGDAATAVSTGTGETSAVYEIEGRELESLRAVEKAT
jgi:hypothetical protein